MKIGIWGSDPDLDKIIRRCRAADVGSITIGPEVVPGYRKNGYIDADQLNKVVVKLKSEGIEVPAFFGSMGSDPVMLLSPNARKNTIERDLSVIQALGYAGIEVLINYVHTPAPIDPSEDESLWAGLLALLERYVVEAEAADVRIANHGIWKCLPEPLLTEACVERLKGEDYRNYRREGWIGPFLVRTVDQIRRMIDAVPSPNNGICMCTGMYITGGNPASEIELFGKHVHFVQIRDISGGYWPNSDEVFPGKGDLDFFEIVRRLITTGYEGYAHAEHLGPARLDYEPADDNFENSELEIAAAAYLKALVRAAETSLATTE
jgi:sugar phosphate isomerase/epimerase